MQQIWMGEGSCETDTLHNHTTVSKIITLVPKKWCRHRVYATNSRPKFATVRECLHTRPNGADKMLIIWFTLNNTVRQQFKTTVSSTWHSPVFQIYQEQLAVWGRRASSCEVKQGHYFNVNINPFNTVRRIFQQNRESYSLARRVVDVHSFSVRALYL